MEASARSWEADFSLSRTTRQRALHSSRLRSRPSIADSNRPPLPIPGTSSDLDTDIDIFQCKNVNSPNLNGFNYDNENEHVDVTPASHVGNPKRRRSNHRKPVALTLRGTDLHCNGMVDTSCSKPDIKELLCKNPCSSYIRSDNVCSAHADIGRTASTPQSSVSLFPRIPEKRAKSQGEILNSVYDLENPPARLEPDFFQCNALELAPKLLGKFLRRDDVVMQITEVEAYCPNDSACHGRFGLTSRTAPMFGSGGHAYVYICYGLHVMLNIVADVKGVGAAVLIRSCAPIAGLQTIQARRNLQSKKPILLTGPGKIGQALGLTTDWSGHPLYTAGGLELLDSPTLEDILVGPRVGIDYANPEDVKALWRFAIPETPWISAPRTNLARIQYNS